MASAPRLPASYRTNPLPPVSHTCRVERAEGQDAGVRINTPPGHGRGLVPKNAGGGRGGRGMRRCLPPACMLLKGAEATASGRQAPTARSRAALEGVTVDTRMSGTSGRWAGRGAGGGCLSSSATRRLLVSGLAPAAEEGGACRHGRQAGLAAGVADSRQQLRVAAAGGGGGWRRFFPHPEPPTHSMLLPEPLPPCLRPL
jgi:hypothetical protein